MAREYVSVDLDWERLCCPEPRFATEEDWWTHHCDREAAMESEAHRWAEGICDMYEFDSDEEREAMYWEAYTDRMNELEEEWT